MSSVHRPLLQGATNCRVFIQQEVFDEEKNYFQFKNLVHMRVFTKQSLKTYLQRKAVRSYKKNLDSNYLFNYIERVGDVKCME
jgi:hypothetical protein